MSIQAITWVLEEAPGLPAHLAMTLMGLANHADENGHNAYPSQATLAHYTRKGDRSVRRDLRELETLGLIRRGDARMVAHLPADRRPDVYDLAVERTISEEDPANVRKRVVSPSGRTPTSARSADLNGRTPMSGRSENGRTWTSGTGGRGRPVAGGRVRPTNRPSEPSLNRPPLQRTPGTHIAEVLGIEEEDGAKVWEQLKPRCQTSPIRYIDSIYGNGDLRAIADQVLSASTGAPRPAMPEWCGGCDSQTRQVENEDGVPRRCPNCHPLTADVRSAS